MIFKESKPIYLQIANRICDEILHGRYGTDGRIPSVREYAATVEVNTNTAMRSYDFLQSHGIIRMKRGIGYFVEPEAVERILAIRRESFMRDEAPSFFHQAHTLGLTDEDLAALYREYIATHESTPTNTQGYEKQ